MRRLLWLLAVVGLAGCATVHGPRSVTLTPEDMERQLSADLGGLMEAFKGLDVRRAEIGLMPVAGRLQLRWSVRLPAAPGEGSLLSWTGLTVEISGKPQLNGPGNAINLTEALIDDIRLDGLPRLLGLGMTGLTDRKGAVLPDFPLFGLPPELLLREGVVYEARSAAVSYRGLTLEIAPK